MSLVALAFLGTAEAACGACAAGDAPAAYTSASCGGHAIEVLGVLIADVDAGSGSATEMWAVTDYGAYGGARADEISVWGTDTAAVDFCCLCDGAVIDMVMEGSDEVDDFSMQSGARQLSSQPVVANGYGSGDLLSGPDTNTLGVALVGNAGGDVLIGGAADETLDAGYGVDTCEGGDGDDGIFGGPDVDTIDAGNGFDYVDGGAGDDGISGGPDGDELWGGNGDDAVCGGTGTNDRINGGPPAGGGVSPTGTNDDQLWAPSGAVTPGGSAVGNNANCGDTTAGHGTWNEVACGSAPCCVYNLTTRPAACP